MTAATVAVVTLIGWLVGLQTLRVGRDGHAPVSGVPLVATAALGAGTVVLLARHLYGDDHRPGPGHDLTAVALIALTGWLLEQQTLRIGHDRNARPSRAALMTATVLGGGAVVLFVPQLYRLVT